MSYVESDDESMSTDSSWSKSGNCTWAGPVPDEGDFLKELEGTRSFDGTWTGPKLLNDGRKVDMEYMRKHGVFEVVDENACHDNGCNPLTLKWVDKVKGDVCRSRLVCREIKKAKNKDEQLGPEDVISPMQPLEGVEDAGVHDDGNHTDAPIEMATWDVSRAHLYGDAPQVDLHLTS